MTNVCILFSVKSQVFLYQLLLIWVLSLGCATSSSLFMLFLFQAVPLPGDNISLPLYKSTEIVNHCYSLNSNIWYTDLSPQQKIFSIYYGMQVDIMWCWKLYSNGDLAGGPLRWTLRLTGCFLPYLYVSTWLVIYGSKWLTLGQLILYTETPHTLSLSS